MSTAVHMLDRGQSGVPGAELDRLFGPLYRHLPDGDIEGALQQLCSLLGEDLPAVLVVITRALDGGTVAIEAAAPTNNLWAALQNLPERWDGSATGHGPAALAIDSGEPAWQSCDEEGFRPWRDAAAREHVAAAGAWPLVHAGQTWLIQVFAADEAFFHNGAIRRRMGRISHELARFLDDAARLRECEMLGSALEHCGLAAFITNLDGEIVWSNRALSRLYGYSADELRGQTPRLLHSGKQGLRYYRDLWSTIRSGRTWSGETVDRDRDGRDHTVRQTVSPFGAGDRITHYLSVHEDISDEVAQREKQQLRDVADPDTGLLNAGSFSAAVDAEIARNEPFTLALLSLRGYRDALSDLGPDLGEAITMEFSARLHDILGPGTCATAAESGEYRLLLPDTKVTSGTLRKIIESLEQPFPMLGRPGAMHLRSALARFPRDGKSRDELMRCADAQLADQPIGRVNRKLQVD